MAEESWVVTGPQVIEVDEVRSLRVQIVGGRIDVVQGEDMGMRSRLRAEIPEGKGSSIRVSGTARTI